MARQVARWLAVARARCSRGGKLLLLPGMGSRERRVGDAWVISDDDEHLDDEDWTGLGF